MKALVRVFDGHEVRAAVVRGEPWFVAKDVCDALGLDQVSRAMDRLEEDERGLLKVTHPQAKEKTIEVNAVNESGLYALILRSNKPEARRFRKWVTSEVLPSIRKTGRYAVSPEERAESASVRSALARQWFEHGADKPHHYINLTRSTYRQIYGTIHKKKADMTAFELAMLQAFESIERVKLMNARNINGYYELAASIESTGKAFPAFMASIPRQLEGARA